MTGTYVVDASVAVQYLIADVHTSRVDTLLAQVDQDITLWVPEFCLLECANVLWKEARFRVMPQTQAVQLTTDLAALPLKVSPVSDLLTRALQLALEYGLAVYDSVYIAMAERLNCPLITVDRKQAQIANTVGVTLKPITDFPPIES